MDDIIVPELQNVDTTLIIDPDTRTIDAGSDFLLGVETDNDAERVKFQCPKIVGDNLDLSQYHIYIHYQNAKGEKGKYLCEDIEDGGENITFSWLLSQKAVLYKGQTKFLVCAKKTQEETIVWNTTLANGNVLEGLDVDEDIVQQNDDVIEQILLKLEQIEASGGIDEETLNQINRNTEDISKLSDEIANLEISGLTTAQVNALNEMFKVCAYTQSDVSTQYNAFKTAFGITDSGNEEPEEPDTPITPTVTLTSISAIYSGGEVLVGTDVDDLTGITVTGTYSDGTTKSIIDYTLSGSINEGSNTITVSYDGKTTTFVVIGYVEQSGESGELTEEELAQLETMPDAYLSDDGQYLYIDPLKMRNTMKYNTTSSAIGTNNITLNITLTGLTQLALKEHHEDMFNGLIPYAKNNNDANGSWAQAVFRDSQDIPELCYGYINNGSDFIMRDGIEKYNAYKDNGDFVKRLYDSFRRVPFKTTSVLRVFELTDEVIDALTGSMATTTNEHGFYTGFVQTPLGGGFGAWSNNNVICSVGGYMDMSGNPSTEYEWYRCSSSLGRFYYYIPQENITDLTLNGLKAYLKTKNIKFFHIAKE